MPTRSFQLILRAGNEPPDIWDLEKIRSQSSGGSFPGLRMSWKLLVGIFMPTLSLSFPLFISVSFHFDGFGVPLMDL